MRRRLMFCLHEELHAIYAKARTRSSSKCRSWPKPQQPTVTKATALTTGIATRVPHSAPKPQQPSVTTVAASTVVTTRVPQFTTTNSTNFRRSCRYKNHRYQFCRTSEKETMSQNGLRTSPQKNAEPSQSNKNTQIGVQCTRAH